jgi:Fe-S cluster biogenesis protein NfuA
MAETDIRITAEPIDDNRCKFVVSQPVLTGGVRRFAAAGEAQGSPLAEAIFAIPGLGVSELIVSGNIVTVVKQAPTPWQAAGRAVGNAIRSALTADVPAIAPAPKPAAGDKSAVSDDALYEQVTKVFDEQVNPMVARHGGRVELIDVQDGVVMLRMGGGCQGCGMADVTLRQGIEGMLAQLVPDVRGIVDITDHTTGSNPYFQASKK